MALLAYEHPGGLMPARKAHIRDKQVDFRSQHATHDICPPHPPTAGAHPALTWTKVWSTGTLLTQDPVGDTLTPWPGAPHQEQGVVISLTSWISWGPHHTLARMMMNSFLTLWFPVVCATWGSHGMSEVELLSVSLSVHLSWSISIARGLLMTLTSQSLPWVDTHLEDFSFYPDLTLNAFIYLKIKRWGDVWGREMQGHGVHCQDHFKVKLSILITVVVTQVYTFCQNLFP